MKYYYLNQDTCVCCGAPVPEGSMVCPNCQKGNMRINAANPGSEETGLATNHSSFWKLRGNKGQKRGAKK